LRITIQVDDQPAETLDVPPEAEAALEAWRLGEGPRGRRQPGEPVESVSELLLAHTQALFGRALRWHPPQSLRTAEEALRAERRRLSGERTRRQPEE